MFVSTCVKGFCLLEWVLLLYYTVYTKKGGRETWESCDFKDGFKMRLATLKNAHLNNKVASNFSYEEVVTRTYDLA